jgi:hypothetical protein
VTPMAQDIPVVGFVDTLMSITVQKKKRGDFLSHERLETF